MKAPLWKPLIYSLPKELKKKDFLNKITPGRQVFVPLGKKRITTGVLLQSISSPEELLEFKKTSYVIKDIFCIDEISPPLPDPFLKWLKWLSKYYFHPIGEVCALSFFAPKRRKNKILLKEELKNNKKANLQSPLTSHCLTPHSKILTNSLNQNINQNSFLKLTKNQQKCFEDIQKEKGFKVHLLHGVTGSGKTEVYLSLIREKIKQKKKALVLVPEISLTPQLVKTFNLRFPHLVAVIHSYLTQKEKAIQWKSVTQGEKKILVGARSALFCPLHPLGIIIVDEEHESSYKQSEKLKYHARDAAIMLAKFLDIPIVLVSANPSMESWKKAKEGKYILHQMNERILSQTLPKIKVIDMRNKENLRKYKYKVLEKKTSQGRSHSLKPSSSETRISSKNLPSWMSVSLYEKLRKNLIKKKQSILFLNRRGEAPLSICRHCGYIFECPHCSVQLTLHKNDQLLCHYCNFKKNVDSKCPACGSEKIKSIGLGTERIEKELKVLFKKAKISRADKDEISSKKALENLIEKMEEKDQIQILIGTQMIAKGLHFPHLTLIGFIMVDIGFNFPDFRSSEKSFQLIMQMSGRSGRALNEKGEVILQSYNPMHISVLFSKNNDYEGFAKKELSHRKRLNYPPYGRLASFRIQSTDKKQAEKTSLKLKTKADEIKNTFLKESSHFQILGPSPAPYTKLKDKYRFHLLIKSPDHKSLHSFCTKLMPHIDAFSKHKLQIQVDIDPIHML